MLVLHRKHGERVALVQGDSLAWLTVLDTGRNGCLLLLEADSDKSEQWVRVHEETQIQLGPDSVSVKINEVYHTGARLGFTAPESVKIWRKELLDKAVTSAQ